MSLHRTRSMMRTSKHLLSSVDSLEQENKAPKEQLAAKTTTPAKPLFFSLFSNNKNDVKKMLSLSFALIKRRIEKNVNSSGIQLKGGSKEDKDNHDKQQITKILDNLDSNFADVKRHKRLLGNTPISESNRPPFIFVGFNEAVKRDVVCKSAHQLR